MLFGEMCKVVVVVPVGDDLRIHIATRAIEHQLRSAARSFGREDPLERTQLSAVGTEHRLQLRELLERCHDLALVAHDGPLATLSLAIDVHVGSI
jgi:hypothetical protein